jgi:zinc/manganese transport system substrate-binding protein
LAACCDSCFLEDISKLEHGVDMPTKLALALTFFAAFGIAPAAAQEKLKVVASFSILSDLVENVGGDRVEVVPLVGPDSDAHVYSPSPADAKKIADAKVVFTNGLGFEGWMPRLIKASGTKAAVIVTTRGIKPRRSAETGHSHAATDPHAWQSVSNVKIYVANIRDALIQADPPGKLAYEANATAYLAKLDALDSALREAVARIPEDRRKIISTHAAFGYFEGAYGIDFIAPQGVSTEAEVSAKDVAKIITQIKKQKIVAVFLENVSDPRLMKRIADESGARIGGMLYSDALTGEQGGAPSYIDMMQHNMRTLSAALTG